MIYEGLVGVIITSRELLADIGVAVESLAVTYESSTADVALAVPYKVNKHLLSHFCFRKMRI